jgi:hypothetical protein
VGAPQHRPDGHLHVGGLGGSGPRCGRDDLAHGVADRVDERPCVGGLQIRELGGVREPAAHPQGRDVRLVETEVEVAVDQAGDGRGRIGGRELPEGGQRVRQHPLLGEVGAEHDLTVEVRLPADVVGDGGHVQPCLGGDPPSARAVVAVFGEEGGGCRDDAFAAGVGGRWGRGR